MDLQKTVHQTIFLTSKSPRVGALRGEAFEDAGVCSCCRTLLRCSSASYRGVGASLIACCAFERRLCWFNGGWFSQTAESSVVCSQPIFPILREESFVGVKTWLIIPFLLRVWIGKTYKTIDIYVHRAVPGKTGHQNLLSRRWRVPGSSPSSRRRASNGSSKGPGFCQESPWDQRRQHQIVTPPKKNRKKILKVQSVYPQRLFLWENLVPNDRDIDGWTRWLGPLPVTLHPGEASVVPKHLELLGCGGPAGRRRGQVLSRKKRVVLGAGSAGFSHGSKEVDVCMSSRDNINI